MQPLRQRGVDPNRVLYLVILLRGHDSASLLAELSEAVVAGGRSYCAFPVGLQSRPSGAFDLIWEFAASPNLIAPRTGRCKV